MKVRPSLAAGLAVASLAATAGPASAAPEGVVAFGSWRCGDGSESAPPDYVGSSGPRLCTESIWRVNDDGSDLRRLTVGRSRDEDPRYAGGDRDPAWSPDGKEIVFTRYMQSEGGRDVLWLMNADGSNQRRLLKEPLPDGHVPEWEADWSPDGERIAFHSWSVGHWGPILAVFIVNRDGSGLRRLTELGLNASEPEFTPDGRILYQQEELASKEESDRRQTVDSGVYIMNADGSDPVRLIQGHRQLYRWRLSAARDMRHITFGNSRSAFVLGLEDGAVRELPQAVHDPTWTAGRRSIVYTGVGQLPTSLFKLEPFGTGIPVQLTDSTSLDRGPDWTPIAGAAQPSDFPRDTRPPFAAPTAVLAAGSITGASTRAIPPALASAGERLPFLAVDRSGIRTVSAALGLRVGHGVCRFRGGNRLGSPRPCTRPLYRRVTSQAAWKARTRGLPDGTYELRFRTADVKGNSTAKPRRWVVRLKR